MISKYQSSVKDSLHDLLLRFEGTKGEDFPHPGLGPDDTTGEGGGYTHHKFYQWVVFVLTLQVTEDSF